MEGRDKSTVREIIRMMLRPIASLVLSCGITWREFSEMSKAAFVERATAEFGIRGRATNVSRVSILTGISRKEVKRQRELLSANDSNLKGKTTDATRLLSGWHHDSRYLDESSVPLELPESGTEPSFASLCRHFGGDIAATTMLKELINTAAVERVANGRLRVLLRYYQPTIHDDEILHNAVSRVFDLVETVNNNVFSEKGGTPRFGGAADNDRIPQNVVPKFHEFLDKRGQAFLEEIDDWLTAHAVAEDISDAKCVRLGIGMFAIEDQRELEKEK